MTVSLQNTNLRIPEFVREKYPLFYKFINYYYQWLGLDGNPGDLSVDTYRSISECPDSHLEFLGREFLPDFPTLNASTLRMLLERHLDFYTAKGSEESIKFLFRVLYQDESVEFFYPQEWIFNASDTTYTLPKIMMCKSSNVNMATMDGALIYGKTTGNTARIDYVTNLKTGGVDYWVLTLTSQTGEFDVDSVVTLTKGAISFDVTLEKLFSDIKIEGSGGHGYCEGDVITSADVDFIITEVTHGGVDSLTILRKGYGYAVGDLITLRDPVDAQTKSTIFAISSVDENGGILDTIVVQKGGPYKFIPEPVFGATTGAGIGVGAIIQPYAPEIGRVTKVELKMQRPQTITQQILWGRKTSKISNEQIFLNNWEGTVRLHPTNRFNYIRQSDNLFYDPFFWPVSSMVGYLDTTQMTPWNKPATRINFIYETGAVVEHRIQQDLTPIDPWPIGNTFTFSVIMKPDTANQFQLKLMNTVTNAEFMKIQYNAITKVITNVSGVDSSHVVDLGNGWIRLTVSGTPLATTGDIHRVVINASADPTSFVLSKAAAGTEGFWIAAAQFEHGAAYTSYISSEAYPSNVIDYVLTPEGIITFWEDTVYQNITNYAIESDTFGSNSGWTTGGASVLHVGATHAPDGTMNGHYISNLGSFGSADYVENLSVMPPSSEISVSFYMKKVSPVGFVGFYNFDDINNGSWIIDLSKMSWNWERIERDHPAVIEHSVFHTLASGAPRHRFYEAFGGDGHIPMTKFYITGYQLEVGPAFQKYIPSTINPGMADVLVHTDAESKAEKERQFAPLEYYRENRQLWSNKFVDSNYWQTNNGSVMLTADVEQAPDGSMTATLVESARWTPNQDAERWLAQYDALKFSIGTTITLSCWIKLIPGTDPVPPVHLWQYPGVSPVLDITEQWKRFTWTTQVGVSTYYGLRFGWPTDGSTNNNRFAIWGFQAEAGTVATDYIDTIGYSPVEGDYGFTMNVTTSGVTKKYFDTRINRQLYSEDFTQIWTRPSNWGTLTPGQIDPYATTRATRIAQSAAVGVRSLAQTDSTRYAPGSTVTMSCWIKLNPGVNPIPAVYFWANSNGYSTALNVTSSWQRFSWTFHVSNSSKYGLMFGWDVNGVANDNTFDIFGFQVEEGSYMSDYIKTTNAQVTVNDYYLNNYGAIIFNDPTIVQPTSVVTWTGTHEGIFVETNSPTQQHPLAPSGYQLLGSRGKRADFKFSTMMWSGKITTWDGQYVYPSNQTIENFLIRPSGAYTLIPNNLQKGIGNGGLVIKPVLANVGKLLAGYRTQQGIASGGSKMADGEYFHHLHYCLRSNTKANVKKEETSIVGFGIVGRSVLGQIAVDNAKEVVMNLVHPAGMKMSWERHGDSKICGMGLCGVAIVGNEHSVPDDLWTGAYDYESGIFTEPPNPNYAVA